MDTRVSPLARREEQRYRVKRVGRRTLGRGVTGEGGGAGDYKRRKIYNPRMKFIRTSHLPLSTLRKLQRASSYSFLSFSLSLSSIFSLSVLRALWQPERTRGRWCEQEISCTVRNRTSRSPTRRPFKKPPPPAGRGKTEGVAGMRIVSRSMEHRSRGFTGNGYEKKMDMRLKRATAPSSRLITIPFPLEIAARRKGDRADLAVEQSVPTNPWQHSSSPFFVWRWRRYHSPDASRWNYCQP